MLSFFVPFCWPLKLLAGGEVELRVKIQASPAYPLDLAIPIGITIENVGDVPWQFRMTNWGVPAGVLAMLDEKGQELGLLPFGGLGLGIDGPPTPLAAWEIIYVKRGETIQWRYDLNRLFEITKPGVYKLCVWTGQDNKVEQAIEIRELKLVKKLHVVGAWSPPLKPLSRMTVQPLVETDVTVLDVPHGPISQRFLCIGKIEISHKIQELPPQVLPIPADSTITQAEMDYLGQIWVVLSSGTKEGLILWSMREERFQVLEPLGEHKVEIGATRAYFSANLYTKVILAGVSGKPKHTSCLNPLDPVFVDLKVEIQPRAIAP